MHELLKNLSPIFMTEHLLQGLRGAHRQASTHQSNLTLLL